MQITEKRFSTNVAKRWLRIFIAFAAFTICCNGQIPISVIAHVQNIGWMTPVGSEQVAGTVGRSLRLEAVQITVPGRHVCYQAHVQNIGWQKEVCDGATAGTTGQSLRMEAIRIRVTPGHIVYYGHVQNTGWTGQFMDGAQAGTTGQSLRLEAIALRVQDTLNTSSGGYEYSGTASTDIVLDENCDIFGFGRSKDTEGDIWVSSPFYPIFGDNLNRAAPLEIWDGQTQPNAEGLWDPCFPSDRTKAACRNSAQPRIQ